MADEKRDFPTLETALQRHYRTVLDAIVIAFTAGATFGALLMQRSWGVVPVLALLYFLLPPLWRRGQRIRARWRGNNNTAGGQP